MADFSTAETRPECPSTVAGRNILGGREPYAEAAEAEAPTAAEDKRADATPTANMFVADTRGPAESCVCTQTTGGRAVCAGLVPPLVNVRTLVSSDRPSNNNIKIGD